VLHQIADAQSSKSPDGGQPAQGRGSIRATHHFSSEFQDGQHDLPAESWVGLCTIEGGHVETLTSGQTGAIPVGFSLGYRFHLANRVHGSKNLTTRLERHGWPRRKAPV
jgi:hypothetical protein